MNVGKPLPDPKEVSCESPYQKELKYCCRTHHRLARVKYMRERRVRIRDAEIERWLQEA